MIIYHFKQAWQSLQKKPGFVFSIVSTMGITLGLLLCVLKLNLLMFVEPLPYPDQEKLFVAEQLTLDQDDNIKTSYFNYRSLLNLYQKQSTFTDSAIIYNSWNLIVDHPQQPLFNTMMTSPEYFKLFDVPMAIGRGFEQSESVKNNVPVAVISYATWEKYFNLSDDILQQKINLGNVHYKIIGVIGQQYIEPKIYEIGRETDIWLPWDIKYWNREDGLSDFPDVSFIFVGKLSNDITVKHAEHSLSELMEKPVQDGNNLNESTKHWRAEIKLTSVKSAVLGNTESIGILLLFATIGLLVIACANIINLFISRIVEKSHQMAIHAAVGAKKNKIFLLVLSEVLLLILASSVVALVIAKMGFSIMHNQFSSILPRVDELQLGKNSLISAITIIVILALSIAKLSSNVINHRVLNLMLSTSGKGTGKQVSSNVRNSLIAIQIAIAALLVFINVALFLQAIKPIIRDKGLNLENVFELYLIPHKQPFESADKRIALTHVIKNKLLERPEIELISHSNLPIVHASQISSTLNDIGETIQFISRRVDHNYFKLVEQRLIQGDNFSIEDIRNFNRVLTGEIEKNLNQVAIVNQNLAKRLKKEGEVIGSLISINGDVPSRIIGIVNDSLITSSLTNQPRAFAPSTEAGFSYLIKFKPNQSMSREEIVSLVTSVTSLYAPYSFESTESQLNQLLFVYNTTAIVTALLAITVLLLAAIGIYGVISYGVQMRRFEFGTRLAIGAKRRSLLGLLLKENSVSILIGIGIAVILLVVLFLGFSEQLLSYVNVELLSAFTVTLGLIGVISFFACYLPLRKIINRPVVCSLKGSD